MKKYVVPVITLAVVLGGAVSPAFAERGSGIRGFFDRFRQEDREDEDESRNEEREGIWNDNRDAVPKGAELRLKLQQQHDKERAERLSMFWEKAGRRLQSIIDRESGMSRRVAEQLARKKAAGGDVSEQEELLRIADAAIATAQTSLTQAPDALRDLRDAQAPVADMIVRARELHREVVGDIRIALRALVDVIVSMRGMSGLPTPTATPNP